MEQRFCGMWTDEFSRYKKSILPKLWRKCFDVDNDDDRSFSTRGLCTRPNPSHGLRQFQNDLYITQRVSAAVKIGSQ